MSREIHITLTARDIREDELSGKIAVVIDVLRATSVIITALANGAKWVKTIATVEEALSLAAPDVLLGGEREALRIDGFDFSNSPMEYIREKVLHKGIVMSTTNGTLALSKCNPAQEVLVGAFINHSALCDYLLIQDLPVELICAGTNGEFSMDDFLCAGLICSTLHRSARIDPDDLCLMAIQCWNQNNIDLHAALSGSTHYGILKSKGFENDLDYCLQKDTHPVVVRKNPMTGNLEALPVTL